VATLAAVAGGASADTPLQGAVAAGPACAAIANADASIRACSEIIGAVEQLANLNVAARGALVLAYFDRGQAYFGKGDYDRSIADFNRAIGIVPNGGLYYNARGYAYEAKGDRQRALADYNMAIQLVPNLIVAYQNRARLRYYMGDYDGAIADTSGTISLAPNAFASYDRRPDREQPVCRLPCQAARRLGPRSRQAPASSSRGRACCDCQPAGADVLRRYPRRGPILPTAAISPFARLPAAHRNRYPFRLTNAQSRYRFCHVFIEMCRRH
jgi:tetratricopeptide (TPR) repeat protein